MPTFPAINGYTNEEELDENVLNRPILALKERTEFLRQSLENIAGQQAFESVRITEVDLDTVDPPALYDFLFFEQGDKYSKAIAASSQDFLTPYQMAENSAFAVGILTDISASGKGTVVLAGKLSIPSSVSLTELLEPDEVFRPGPYYLSTAHKGKATATPKGPAVYLGFIMDGVTDTSSSGTILLSPQYKDLWNAHSHFKFVLEPNVAGRHVRTGTDPADDSHGISSFQSDTPGDLGCFILGNYTNDESGAAPTYTLILEGTDFSDLVLKWSTNDGSDDGFPGQTDPQYGTNTGVRVTSFYRPVEFGSFGMKFALHQDLDPLNMPVGSNSVSIPGAAAERTWTLELPTAAKGWIPNEVSGEATSTDGDLPFILFSYNYDNAAESTNPIFRLVVTTAGDTVSGGPFPDVEVYDSEDTLLNTIVGATDNTLYPVADGLFLYVGSVKSDGTTATTALTIGQEWDFSLTDRAPQSVFKYSVGFDKSLKAYYPPSPVSSVLLEFNGMTIPQYNEFTDGQGLYTPAVDTIYWRDDQFTRAPWNQDIQFEPTPEARFNADVAVYMTKMALNTAGIVNSIKAEDGAPISIVDCLTGEPASTGDLLIKAAFNFSILDGKLNGFKVVKGIDASGNLLTGPVVEKVTAGANILVESDPNFPGQGVAKISAVVEGSNRGQFHDVNLQNAKYERVRNRHFTFIKLLNWNSQATNNIKTGFNMQFRVPDYLPSNYKVAFYLTTFGLSDVALGGVNDGVQYAGLKLSYDIVPDLTEVNGSGVFTFVGRNLLDVGANGILTGEADFDLTLGIASTGYTAYDPMLLTNDPVVSPIDGQVIVPSVATIPFAVADIGHVTAGDVVSLKIERQAPITNLAGSPVAGTAYEYTNEIGFLNLDWKLIDVGAV